MTRVLAVIAIEHGARRGERGHAVAVGKQAGWCWVSFSGARTTPLDLVAKMA